MAARAKNAGLHSEHRQTGDAQNRDATLSQAIHSSFSFPKTVKIVFWSRNVSLSLQNSVRPCQIFLHLCVCHHQMIDVVCWTLIFVAWLLFSSERPALFVHWLVMIMIKSAHFSVSRNERGRAFMEAEHPGTFYLYKIFGCQTQY